MTLDDLFKNDKKEVKTVALIDFYGIMWASFHVANSSGSFVSDNFEDLKKAWRFLILKMILKVKQTINPDDLILCSDVGSWRKDAFKYYKANRVFDEEKQQIDKKTFFEVVDEFLEEYRNNFPYKIIRTEKAEADDVIAVLSELLTGQGKEVFIVSRDKDFKQLLANKRVKIYNPIDEKMVECDDPYIFLIEHILTGDKGDGIPNILSEDNIFLQDGKRQKSITQGIKKEVMDTDLVTFAEKNNVEANLSRNKKLITLSSDYIPSEIVDKILFKYNSYGEVVDNREKIFSFFVKNDIKSLYDDVGNFLL